MFVQVSQLVGQDAQVVGDARYLPETHAVHTVALEQVAQSALILVQAMHEEDSESA